MCPGMNWSGKSVLRSGQLREHMQEGGDAFSLPDDEDPFWGSDLDFELLNQKMQTFSSNVVLVSAPANHGSKDDEIRCASPKSRKPLLTYTRREQVSASKGRQNPRPGRINTESQKIIYFWDEEPRPIPEPEIKGSQYFFDESEEEERTCPAVKSKENANAAADQAGSSTQPHQRVSLETLAGLFDESLQLQEQGVGVSGASTSNRNRKSYTSPRLMKTLKRS